MQEDLERIAELERRVKAAHEEVERVQEEMKYFKLELRNREQNFNKVFGSNGPNVGVSRGLQLRSRWIIPAAAAVS